MKRLCQVAIIIALLALTLTGGLSTTRIHASLNPKTGIRIGTPLKAAPQYLLPLTQHQDH